MCVGPFVRSFVRPFGPKMADFGTPKITFLQLYADFGESKSGHFPLSAKMSAFRVRIKCPHPMSAKYVRIRRPHGPAGRSYARAPSGPLAPAGVI